MARFMIALTVVFLTSCISIPGALIERISIEGAHMTSVAKVWRFTLIRTASIIPGDNPARGPDHAIRCGDGVIDLDLAWSDEGHEEIHDCELILNAVEYGALSQGRLPARVRFSVTFAPRNSRVSQRTRSLFLGRRPAVRYVLPTLDSSGRTTGNAVSVISHESYHVFAALNGEARHVVENENVAHWIGACAQFELLGEVEIGTSALRIEEGDFPSHVVRSNNEGLQVTYELKDLSGGRSRIEAGSEAADAMMSKCRSLPNLVEELRRGG